MLVVKETYQNETYEYLSGFGNTLQSECLPGALPQSRNNPRQVPYGLYTEQLSGTAFTAPRHKNQRTWCYRIVPSVVSVETTTNNNNVRLDSYFGGPVHPKQCQPCIDPLRWKPMEIPTTNTTFLNGNRLFCTAGDVETKYGLSIYQYGINASMHQEYMVNTDGLFLIVPQSGTIRVQTEFGRLCVRPTEIVVIPRGIVFSLDVLSSDDHDDTTAEPPSSWRGYVLEIYDGGAGFQLPELGPIGANGLANARDFLYPVARCCVDNHTTSSTDPTMTTTSHRIITKSHSVLFARTVSHSPYNVVAYHGNYLPYKYDLKKFCAINSVSYDHIDPSIYTVLTCPSVTPGTALADFVIFPPRVLATDPNTFRPPWFHKNCMSEFMGLISGSYDAKTGFVPGGASLHGIMTPHGPDAESYHKAVADPCDTPAKLDDGLAFMFETCLSLRVAPQALDDPNWRDMDYQQCWQGLTDENFEGWELLQDTNNKSH
jgi:homogentisate 1,2-dioxygenase